MNFGLVCFAGEVKPAFWKGGVVLPTSDVGMKAGREIMQFIPFRSLIGEVLPSSCAEIC